MVSSPFPLASLLLPSSLLCFCLCRLRNRGRQPNDQRLRFADVDVFELLAVDPQVSPQLRLQVRQVRVDATVVVDLDPEITSADLLDGNPYILNSIALNDCYEKM